MAGRGNGILVSAAVLVELSDWRTESGLRFPARMVQPADGREYTWTHFEPGAEHEPGLFVRPVR